MWKEGAITMCVHVVYKTHNILLLEPEVDRHTAAASHLNLLV
jgi:hypothetical protein